MNFNPVYNFHMLKKGNASHAAVTNLTKGFSISRKLPEPQWGPSKLCCLGDFLDKDARAWPGLGYAVGLFSIFVEKDYDRMGSL